MRYKNVSAYTAISIKVVHPKAKTVNYERTGDDGLMLIFSSKLGIISLKQHVGTQKTYDGKFTCYIGNLQSTRAKINNNPSSLGRS